MYIYIYIYNNNNNNNNNNDNFCCLLGRDPGTLKSDIVSQKRKHAQLICSDLRLSNLKFED